MQNLTFFTRTRLEVIGLLQSAHYAYTAMTDYSMQDKIEELEQRKSEAIQAGPERAVERQHEKGKLLARERIDYLLDEGSFHELDMLARHRAHEAGLETRPYTDGVVTGWGTIDAVSYTHLTLPTSDLV